MIATIKDAKSCVSYSTVAFRETQNLASLQGETSFIKTITLPILDIILDISVDVCHFPIIADDVVVESGLPFKCQTMFAGIFGHTDFETTNHRRQVSRLWTKMVSGGFVVAQCYAWDMGKILRLCGYCWIGRRKILRLYGYCWVGRRKILRLYRGMGTGMGVDD